MSASDGTLIDLSDAKILDLCSVDREDAGVLLSDFSYNNPPLMRFPVDTTARDAAESILKTLDSMPLNRIQEILYIVLGNKGLSVSDLVGVNHMFEKPIGQYCKGCHHCSDITRNTICHRCWSIKHQDSELKCCQLCKKEYCKSVCWQNTPNFYRKGTICDSCILYKNYYECNKCTDIILNGSDVYIQEGHSLCSKCVDTKIEYVCIRIQYVCNKIMKKYFFLFLFLFLFVICYLLFVICYLLFAICYLFFIVYFFRQTLVIVYIIPNGFKLFFMANITQCAFKVPGKSFSHTTVYNCIDAIHFKRSNVSCLWY